MRHTSSMNTTLLIFLFVASVCHGAVTPVRQEDCRSELSQYLATSDCVECVCEPGGSLRNCIPRPCSPSLFSGDSLTRRKRQTDAATTESSQVTAAKAEAPPETTSPNGTSSNSQLPAEVTVEVAGSVLTGAPAPSTPAPDAPTAQAPAPASSSASPATTETTATSPRPPTNQGAVVTRLCKPMSTWEEECNSCWCLDIGMAACTSRRCEAVTPLSPATTTAAPTAASSTESPAAAPTTSAPTTSSTSTSQPTPSTQTSSSESPSSVPSPLNVTDVTPPSLTSSTDAALGGAS